jgi:hypothetical protein
MSRGPYTNEVAPERPLRPRLCTRKARLRVDTENGGDNV